MPWVMKMATRTRTHVYRTQLTWTGADAAVPFYNHRRDYCVTAEGKPPIEGSSDPIFRGDAFRWNPEDLLVASLSACHQLWYLGLCAASGIEVLAYEDAAEGTMIEERANGAGQFTAVTLRPRVTVAPGADQAKALALHEVAHAHCFIARSVNFPVRHEATVTVSADRSRPNRPDG
jgi:organic hydroperoxide reductase OsmC/OhrA